MFEIKRLDTSRGSKTVVIATSYENPLSNLSDIAKKLRSLHCTRREEVLFDLLCTNGNEWNRFALIQYDGQSFLRSTFHIVSESEVEADILKSQSTFFRSHPELIESSVLY